MRAAKKALGFSVVHFFVAVAVAYALTGQWAVSLGVALIEPAINAILIFIHARWEEGHLTWGREGQGGDDVHMLAHA
jgi:uncharacterized membrane protein